MSIYIQNTWTSTLWTVDLHKLLGLNKSFYHITHNITVICTFVRDRFFIYSFYGWLRWRVWRKHINHLIHSRSFFKETEYSTVPRCWELREIEIYVHFTSRSISRDRYRVCTVTRWLIRRKSLLVSTAVKLLREWSDTVCHVTACLVIPSILQVERKLPANQEK